MEARREKVGALIMLEYANLFDTKKYCGVQHNAKDQQIQTLIYACSSAVKNYLKSASAYEPSRDAGGAPVLDSAGYPEVDTDSDDGKTVRAEVEVAVMYWVDLLLKDPDSAPTNGEPPQVVRSLLYPLRDPALA